MTKKLYYHDSYKTEFDQKILSQEIFNDFYSVVFNETYFYPTTGGQEHDIGFINDIEVVDVIEQNDNILHIVKKQIIEEIVKCRIDWNRRFDFMQQHTGQHILSESIQKTIKAFTVSSRLSEQSSTVDIDTPNMNYDLVMKIEEFANQIIYKNSDIKIHFVDESEINKFPLRKPPKFSGEIRIVEVDGFDFSACGGTHCKKSGEVGIIKIRSWEKIKGNLTRLEFYCGKRALNDYQWKNNLIVDLSNSLTTKDTELNQQINKIITDNKTLNKEITILKDQVISYEITDWLNKALIIENNKVIKYIFDNRSIEEVRLLAQKIIQHENCVVLFGIIGVQANIILACSESLKLNMMQLFKQISLIIDARGGGKPNFVQAGCKNSDKIDTAFEEIIKSLGTL